MKFGFLLYDSRSGSTLLSALLNQYEGLHVSREIKYVTQILDWPKEIESDQELEKLLDHLFSYVQMAEAGIDRLGLSTVLSTPIDKRSLIEATINYHFREQLRGFCIIKHAPMRYIDHLKDLFLEVKYVHILRDVRGVHASKKKTIGTHGKRMSTNVIKSCRYWKQKLATLARTSAQVHHLKYEDLLNSEEATIAGVLAHLGIVNPIKTGTVSDYSSGIGDSQSSLHDNLNKGVLKTRAESWRTDLTPSEIKAIETSCSDLLIQWNYPITHSKGTTTYPVFMLNETLVFTAELLRNAVRSLARGNFRTRLNYFLGKGK